MRIKLIPKQHPVTHLQGNVLGHDDAIGQCHLYRFALHHMLLVCIESGGTQHNRSLLTRLVIKQFHMNTSCLRINIGIDGYKVKDVERTQLYLSDHTVPVALRLVGHGMRVLPHLHRFGVVIHTNGNSIFAWFEQTVKIILMRHRKRVFLIPHFLTIHPHLSSDMRTFQIERVHGHSLILGQYHGTLIPRFAHIVFVGCEEELQLHVLPRLTILLHIRIEEIAGVIKRANPLGIHANVIAF